MADGTLWKTIARAPQYEISEFGTVRRRLPGVGSPAGKVLSTTRHHFGYTRVKLTIQGKHQSFEVYRLVAEAFIGARPFPKAEVCHKDGDATNNHYTNLMWGTHAENESHKRRHGTSPSGERNGAARLTPEIIRAVRRAYPAAGSMAKVGRIFGLTPQHVFKIVSRKLWSSVETIP